MSSNRSVHSLPSTVKKLSGENASLLINTIPFSSTRSIDRIEISFKPNGWLYVAHAVFLIELYTRFSYNEYIFKMQMYVYIYI